MYLNKDNRSISSFISGGISGFFFTLLSHPFHVLTTRYNREIIKGNIQPSLMNSINYTKQSTQFRLSHLFKGAPIRTLQGTLTFSFLYFSKEYFGKQTSSPIRVSAYSGFIENIVIRQPFLTVTSAYINGDRILNSALWLNVIKSYPLTSLFRSLYFTSSTAGKITGTYIYDYGSKKTDQQSISRSIFAGSIGIAFSIRFSAFSESFTNALSSGENIKSCFLKGIRGSNNAFRDINLISRESLFLIPFLFPIFPFDKSKLNTV